MYCRKCGKQIPDDSAFCQFCGTILEYTPELVSNNTSDTVPISEERGEVKSADVKNYIHDVIKRIKKIPDIALIAAAIAVVLAIVLLVLNKNVFTPSKFYNNGVTAMEAGDYESAIEAFSAYDFKDSQEQIKECKYIIANDAYEECSYSEAIDLFRELGSYKDSEDLLNICIADYEEDSYNKAVDLYRSGSYASASSIFEELGNYKNTSKYLTLIKGRTNPTQATIDSVIKILGFEDASDVLFQSYSTAAEFLEGTWSGSGWYFHFMKKDNGAVCDWSFPGVPSAVWDIKDGYFITGNTRRCKLEAISSSIIVVSSLGESKTVTMNKTS